jgi:hypothetical protein
MGSPASTPFAYPNCNARYEVVRVEMGSAPDLQLNVPPLWRPAQWSGRPVRFEILSRGSSRRGSKAGAASLERHDVVIAMQHAIKCTLAGKIIPT